MKTGLFAAVILVFLGACGKDSGKVDEETQPGLTHVSGKFLIGNQCPFGSISDPVPVDLQMGDCPQMIGPELVEAPAPLMIQADCRKKLLSVRTADRKTDVLWELMPDGLFNMTVDAGKIQLRNGGAEHPESCSSFITMDLSGKVDCSNQDKASIQVDSQWTLGKGKKPNDFKGSLCQLPSSCYLKASAVVKQCQ